MRLCPARASAPALRLRLAPSSSSESSGLGYGSTCESTALSSGVIFCFPLLADLAAAAFKATAAVEAAGEAEADATAADEVEADAMAAAADGSAVFPSCPPFPASTFATAAAITAATTDAATASVVASSGFETPLLLSLSHFPALPPFLSPSRACRRPSWTIMPVSNSGFSWARISWPNASVAAAFF